jgi:4a-hydroxytetrahydrobiopterin dehydratase
MRTLDCRNRTTGFGGRGFRFGRGLVFKEMIPYYGLMFSDEPPHLPSLKMLGEGSTLFAASWLWSAVTSFSLLHEASANSLQSLKNSAAPPMPKLEASQIAPRWPPCRNWQRQGDMIARTFQFKDFPAALNSWNAVAGLAEEAWHHPDIDIRWNKVTLSLTTHDAGGLTEKDFALARQFDSCHCAEFIARNSRLRERNGGAVPGGTGRGSRPIQMSPTPWFHSSCGMPGGRRARRG